MGRDNPCVRQRLPVDDLFPPVAAKQQKWHRLHTAGLYQGQRFKHFIQRAKATRKDTNGFGPHQEVHFANGKVVKVERQFWRDILVGRLFVR